MPASDARRAARAPTTASAVLAIALGVFGQACAVALALRSLADPSANVLAGLPVAPVDARAAYVNTQLLLSCLALQAVAALFIAVGSAHVMPRRYRTPLAKLLSYLWVLNFAVPFGGVVCTLGALAIAARLPQRVRNPAIERVDEPQFAANLMGTVSYGRGARLKAELQNADVATSFRMTALLAMQSMPTRTVSPLLQSMLADPLDDIRLLAYGILDNREKQLTQRILAERAQLDGKTQPAATGAARRRANKALAELYSELIYANLVTGDVYRNAADQADAYAKAALEADPADASLWRLRGRLALDRRDLGAAEPMLQRAIDCGFSRARMLPYLAETAYLQRDYLRVRQLLAEVDLHGTLPTLRPVLDYWLLQHRSQTPDPH
ncbi:sugar ABC transporter permease [Trinickia mobilis]|uniref:sugar ABC transporter permease n=1 Tax=Trinickia mobilis TaxID=2816356 RepID=UPI001F5D3866|nr:sugar ABC transporter permease [Trinickia mobilis]